MMNGAREPGWTLRRRLQAIITLALLPVVLVSIFQGVARARLDIATVHDKLLQSAHTVAAGDQNLLAAAEQVLRAVGSLTEVRGMSGNCDGVLADTLIGVRYFSNLTRIDASGRVACSAMALAHGQSVKDYAVFAQAQKTDGMAVSNELISRVTGQPVIGGMLALHKPDGSFDGTVAIALDVHWIDYMMRSANLPKGAVVAVFDRSGKVIATNNKDVGSAIAKAALSSGADPSEVSSVVDSRGDLWRYGNAALMGNSIFVTFDGRKPAVQFHLSACRPGFRASHPDDRFCLGRHLAGHRPAGDAMDQLSAPHRGGLSQRPLHHPS